MQLGMIGLGRMGGNIVRRLMKHGHSTVVYDKDPKAVAALAADGAVGAGTLEDFVDKLERPRTAWVMLPAGKITEATIDTLSKLMQAGDVIIDGGNTFWQDDVRRGAALKGERAMAERSRQFDRKLLEILVCPITKGPLEYDSERGELISRQAGLAYPIRDGLPIMLVDEARSLDGNGP